MPTKSLRTLGFGPDENHETMTVFERNKAHPSGKRFHLAFNALNRATVVEFHDAVIRHGGTSDDERGLRTR